MKPRLGHAVAFVIGVMVVGVPAGAATLITSKQIKNDTIRSVDVKDESLTGRDIDNGSIKAADLAAALRSSPVTVLGRSTTVAPAFDDTIVPALGTSSYEITVTRPGDLLLLTAGNAFVSESGSGTFSITAALYLDETPVAGSVSSASAPPCGLPPCSFIANASPTINGLVIPDVSVDSHVLSLRYTSTNPITAVGSAILPMITLVELG